jgi:hypothetical protein
MEEQNLMIACGSSYLDERQLQAAPLCKSVSIFLKVANSWGYVTPGVVSGFEVDFASTDRHIPQVISRLKCEFGIDPAGELAPVLRNYAQFLSKAKRYRNERLDNDAYVHYVISLELLFGERSRVSDSISKRIATIVFGPFGVSITEAEKKLDKLYDARSRYVHGGQTVDPKLLKEVNDICEEVLWAMLRRIRQNGAGDDMIQRWTRDLDYVYSALSAGKVLSDEDMRSCGICS